MDPIAMTYENANLLGSCPRPHGWEPVDDGHHSTAKVFVCKRCGGRIPRVCWLWWRVGVKDGQDGAVLKP